jgi:phosphoribosyl 1,2-cyclic phosphodiesterase
MSKIRYRVTRKCNMRKHQLLLLHNLAMVKVTLLGVAQDGGVPQCGCSCSRCLKVHEGNSPELFPVSIGIRGRFRNFICRSTLITIRIHDKLLEF